MALNSLAIDIMLPALQQIGASLGVENENHRQYVITAYILGFGSGQLFFGPVSDRFGRRAPLVAGLIIYVAAVAAAAVAPTFAILLAFRIVLTNRIALCYAFASTFIFGAMFGLINSAQQIYLDVFHVGELFPLIFAGVGGVLAFSNFLNARLVGRIGMRRLSQSALLLF